MYRSPVVSTRYAGVAGAMLPLVAAVTLNSLLTGSNGRFTRDTIVGHDERLSSVNLVFEQ